VPVGRSRRGSGRSRRRYGLAAAALGIPLSQVGHLIAYFARDGGRALALQSQGVHSYFPGLLQLSVGLIGALGCAGLVVIGLARIVARHGQGLRASGGHPIAWLLVLSFAVQLDVYVVQETVESALSGVPFDLGLLWTIVAWGMVGQLPVAAAAAVGLHWLSARFEPALRLLLSISAARSRIRPPLAPALRRWTAPPRHAAIARVAHPALAERAPPPLSTLGSPSGV
jgi:hypothetical protein